MESIAPKPMLTKYAGKTIVETPFADTQDPKKLAIERLVVPDANGNQRTTRYPLQIGFRQHGQSGIEVSDWLPHIARQIDRLAIIRFMWTTDSNHGAQPQFHSGRHQAGHYLGPVHDTVPLRVDPSDPLDYGRPERPFPPAAQAVGIDLLKPSISNPRLDILSTKSQTSRQFE